jgi:hypothetical protein
MVGEEREVVMGVDLIKQSFRKISATCVKSNVGMVHAHFQDATYP